jgi:P-type E1-E2 ATPase
MKYNIPHVDELEINTIVLDLNGTLSVNGSVVDGAKERIEKLLAMGIEVTLFTGDQRGTADELCKGLGISYRQAKTSDEKERFFKEFDVEKTAAIGNARIDIGMFKHAALSVATLQAEGIHTDIIKHVDIIVPSINDALDLFIDSNSLKATMRK